jgi:tRNA (guanine37-N1)-methyltransferase
MTRSLAVKVPSSEGEMARRRLLEESLLRTDLRVRREGASLLLPVVEGAGIASGVGELLETDFAEVDDHLTPRRYQDLVECPAELRDRLPRSFDVIGDIVLVRIPPEVESLAPAIGEALLRFVPHVRIAGRDHGVHGPERRRTLSRLAGEGEWKTVHHENGVAIHVDVERAYFSPRLAREHAEVARAAGSGEVVYDLCCGVGPFSLAIAREGKATRIVAVDSNPAAIGLLRESLARARGGNRIEPVEADVEVFLSTAGPVDRAILNLPHEGIKYLASVAHLVRPGGTIHYYEVVVRDALARRAEQLMDEAGGPSHWSKATSHVVHPYSPASDLIAFTLTATSSTRPV